jgi:PKD domain
MAGRVTLAKGVRGEHRGQRLARTWRFAPTCPTGPCAQVTLKRQRSRHRVQTLQLRRVRPNRYVGRGRFYVALRCGARTYPHGGVAFTIVRVRVRTAQTVQATPFATRIAATYRNPRRVNRTPCAGSIGRDGGVYSGRLASALPAPPVADFTTFANPATETASFTDASQSPTGAAIVSWAWDFGDPGSGQGNTSALPDPSHRYGLPGAYTVTLTVTDSEGLTATVTHQIVV